MIARRAMRELREHGLIFTAPGKGSYVTPTDETSAPSPEEPDEA
ncbi:hypothetical protein OHS70_09785 [Streptomyces sp. NBC_00390]